MGAVRVEQIAVGHSGPPHGLKIELTGAIDKDVGEDLVLVLHEYGREFEAAVGAAFERVFLRRLWDGDYRWAGRGRKAAANMRQNGTIGGAGALTGAETGAAEAARLDGADGNGKIGADGKAEIEDIEL